MLPTKQSAADPRELGQSAAAKIAGVHTDIIYRAMHNGVLPHHRDANGRKVVTPEDLQTWMRQSKARLIPAVIYPKGPTLRGGALALRAAALAAGMTNEDFGLWILDGFGLSAEPRKPGRCGVRRSIRRQRLNAQDRKVTGHERPDKRVRGGESLRG
jgi:hypothetical protein